MSASPITGQVTVSGVAQPLSAVTVAPTVWVLKIPGSQSQTVYIGDKSVTVGTGFPMEPGDEKVFDRRPVPGIVFDITPADLYVIGAGGVAAWLGFR